MAEMEYEEVRSSMELTEYQRLFWAGQQRWSQHAAYNVTTAFEIDAVVDANRFEEAFRELREIPMMDRVPALFLGPRFALLGGVGRMGSV